MKSITSLLLSTLTITSLAIPQNPLDTLLGVIGLNGLVGHGPNPLPTSIHSPQCANYNNGTSVCCASYLNGGNELVKDLAALSDYPLTENNVNGLVDCEVLSDNEDCSAVKLCCGSITLLPAAALYCQFAQ